MLPKPPREKMWSVVNLQKDEVDLVMGTFISTSLLGLTLAASSAPSLKRTHQKILLADVVLLLE